MREAEVVLNGEVLVVEISFQEFWMDDRPQGQ